VHPSNRGEAAARNTGVQSAAGKIIAFTDDDCIPPRDWLMRHAAYYADPRIAAVGGPLRSPAPNFYDHFFRAYYAAPYDPNLVVERITNYQHIGTGNMSVRRAACDQVGPFDEAFATGCDTDFVRRLSQAGLRFVRDSTLGVDHLKAYDLGSFLRMRFHRGCGSVLTDVREGTVRLQRFLPLPNLVRAWQGWRQLRQAHGGGIAMAARYSTLVVAARAADAAERAYYYWTRGRRYRPPAPAT
jgi:GT2 family glycosyltransferase